MENTALDLKLTQSAIQQIKKLLSRDDRSGHGLRVGVAGGGCSGFSYKLDFDKEQKPDDVILELAGVSIYVDRASAPYLAGTVIDFVSGLHVGGFRYNYHIATSYFGCYH